MFLRAVFLSTLLIAPAFADPPAKDDKAHAVLRVDTVKPGLTRRDALTVQGSALGEARGGWTFSTASKSEATKIVITVDGNAPANVVVAKNEVPFKTTVEIAELKDKKTGTYNLEVKSAKGETLWAGSWVDGQVKETAACPTGELVQNRGSRSQFCAPIDGKCAAGRKGVVTPISGGQPMCIADSDLKK